MQSEMGENITPLVAVDYTPHLRLLLEALNNQPVFEIQPNTLTLRVADIASAVVRLASERKNARRPKPLAAPFAYTIGTMTATVHHEGEQAIHSFGRLIEQLRAVLLTKANDALASSTLTSTSLSEYVMGLTTHMQQLSSEKPAGLHYPFAQPQTLQKRRMHLRSQKTRPNASAVRYRGHKLTITLENATSFDEDIIEALCTVLQERSASDEEIAETRAVLARRKDDPTSEIARLKKLTKEESLGRLKMEAGLRFLRQLTTEMSTYQQSSATPQREREGLGELQRFLHMLERFRAFLDDPSRSDSDYQVSYAHGMRNEIPIFQANREKNEAERRTNMRKLWVKAWMTLDEVFDADTMDHWWPPADEAAVDYARRLEYIAEEYSKGDMYLLGRTTYEMLWPGWSTQTDTLGSILNRMKKYVVSTTLQTAPWKESTIIRDNVVEEITKLKQQPGKDIIIDGSATLVQSLMGTDLIDEYRFLVVSYIMGRGRRFFPDGTAPTKLRLVESKRLSAETLALIYQPDKK